MTNEHLPTPVSLGAAGSSSAKKKLQIPRPSVSTNIEVAISDWNKGGVELTFRVTAKCGNEYDAQYLRGVLWQALSDHIEAPIESGAEV